jgi:hypothetical protein
MTPPPYAWVDGNSRIQSKQIDPLVDIPLYKKLPWQGLSEKEIDELTKNVIAFKSDIVKFIRETETKLKEKNT